MEYAWLITSVSSKFFFVTVKRNMKAAKSALSYSKQLQNNRYENIPFRPFLPQSLSDWHHLGDTCYHKLRVHHLEVSKHQSARSCISFLKTI